MSELPANGRLLGSVRKDRIARTIRENGFMSSAALAEMFGVSEMTVRRDLTDLESRGEIQRTHGGAMTEAARGGPREGPREPFFDERHRLNIGAKARIARAAAKLVAPRQTIALDVGTTTYELARLLVADPAMRIFTNNLRIASLEAEAEVYVLGGLLRQKELSLIGPVAVEQARKLWFDLVFLGVSSVSSGGLFDYSIEETELKRVYACRAARRVVLADSSKFGEMALVQIGGLAQFDVLVTEATPPAPLMADLVAAGVEVVVADAA